jgi:hypothetical protein
VTGEIAIYFEGGGDSAKTRHPLRLGMSAFLAPVKVDARKHRIRFNVIACGGRGQAYGAFVDAMKNEPEVLNVLLVDSEEPVPITSSPWKHVKEREGDNWNKPPAATDEQLQMMVACMEAWFLADPKGLKEHYGGNFDTGKLPAANLAESRTKADINDALKKATKNTKAKEYQKIRDGAKLLEKVDPAVVRKHCQWCERLFVDLGTVIGVTI